LKYKDYIEMSVEGRLPSALERAAEKKEREYARAAEREDLWGIDAVQAIARKWLPELAEGLEVSLRDGETQQVVREFLAVIRAPVSDPHSKAKLSSERLALCILHGALQSIGKNEAYTDTAAAIGRNIYTECLFAKLLVNGNGLAKRIERRIAKGSLDRRQDKARAEAEKAGYRTDRWNDRLCVQAGNWAINQLLILLPDVFERDDKSGQEIYLTLAPAAVGYLKSFVEDVIRHSPVWLPETKPPRPWTGLNEGGTWDALLQKSLKLIRSWHQETDAAVSAAIREGKMQPALDALNALQAVPWKINVRVLEVIHACLAAGVVVKGLPNPTDPPVGVRLNGLTKKQERAWEEKERKMRRRNRRNRNDRVGLLTDLKTAEALAAADRFWTPMNFDWRERIYSLPHFNFQRDDRIRALFLFADGAPIGEEGLRWLKVHIANCGDGCGGHIKISKEPFPTRVAWVDAHREEIEHTAKAPLETVEWWSKAADPFQFLAACFELAGALAEGPTYIAHLPVSFDGSCSGLQHLCAMIRAPEGGEVNLTPSERPQDIYQTVANKTRDRIKNDRKREDVAYQRMWLAYDREHGITRNTVKPNVMVYGYSGTKEGMAIKQEKELVGPLDDEALLNDRPRLFGETWQERKQAARYLAGHINEAIEEVVKGPAEVKQFLRALANAATNADKPLRWTTPVGIPWINRYHSPIYKPIKLRLQARATLYATKRAVGEQPQIDKAKAANAAAPNFVHACDAAHLMVTVNAAVADGIKSIATVHDSFGCLPSQAERFRHIILEQFVKMYQEHDVLAEVLAEAQRDVGGQKLPPKPEPGDLEIEEVLKAQFAFA
jgi:DNA-directed RNA polymerase, mitochondrial